MHRMETLATSLHRYRDVHGAYPPTQPSTQLVQTLGIRDYPELTRDAWDHEFRYESKGCRDCGFLLASQGRSNAYEHSDLASYPPTEALGSHTNVVCSDRGWVVYPIGTVGDGGKISIPVSSKSGKPLDLR